MKNRFFSSALALCLCISTAPKAYAYQEPPPIWGEVWQSAAATVSREVTNPTETEAYNSMSALKTQYPEGTPWTNSTPYTMSNSYNWKGSGSGSNVGVSGGVGCAAFAFLLSDAAFGSLPARMKTGGCKFDDVHVGDILRVNNNAHTVIVLQKSSVGVVLAEGNYSGKVHWGRTMTKAEVENASTWITRYVDGTPTEDGVSPDAPFDENATGELAEGLNWKLSKSGTLTVSGTGAMPDYTNGNQPWSAYLSQILNVVIEDGVTRIGNNAFYGSKAMSVTIPGSVTEIGDEAFRACEGLKAITLPASIEKVGAGAFMSSGLTYAEFTSGDKNLNLGANTFTACRDLVSVSLPQNIDRIRDGTFASCTVLRSLYIPKSVKEFGEEDGTPARDIFNSCNFLSDIYFGGSETEWNNLLTPYIKPSLQGKTVHYNADPPNHLNSEDDVIKDPNAPDTPDPPHTHTYGEPIVTKQPTCTEPGEQTLKCSCGDTKTESISPLGHNYGSYTTTKKATCTTSGQQTARCSRCNSTTTRTISALGHNYGSYITTKPATCTTSGQQTATCSRCNDSRTKTIPALGHDPGEPVVTKEPTCTEPGEQTTTCSRCDFSKKEHLHKLGHDYVESSVKEPTCEEPGERISTCSRCGDTMTEHLHKLGHKTGEPVVTKEPTCTEPGKQESTCLRCGNTFLEEISATGHDFVLNETTGNYECKNERNESGVSATIVAPVIKKSYQAITLKKQTANASYKKENDAKRYAGSIVRKTLEESVDKSPSYTINTIRYTAPTTDDEGEYVYTVTLKYIDSSVQTEDAQDNENIATAELSVQPEDAEYINAVDYTDSVEYTDTTEYIDAVAFSLQTEDNNNSDTIEPSLQAENDGNIDTVEPSLNERQAATTLTTEPLYLVIPKISSADEPYPVKKYTISIVSNDIGGAVIPSASCADEGDSVTLTVTPNEGYKLSKIIVSDSNEEISVQDLENGNYSFIMPADNVKVEAIFEKEGGSIQPEPVKYSVTVTGSYAATSGAGSYETGATVSIDAGSRSDYRFNGWTSPDEITFANAGNASTTFIMPDKAVAVTANWTYNGASGGSGGSGGSGSSGGSGGSSGSVATYSPTVENSSENGSVTVSPSSPKQGDTVTIKSTPNQGYETDKITVTDKNDKPVEVKENPDGTFSFTQPDGRVKIKATYKTVETPWTNSFGDISESDWYYEAVQFVNAQGLMNGYGDGRFAPEDNLSRAQLAQILFNKEGRPSVNYPLNFSDVTGEAWYTEAVRWASSRGIVSGYGNELFGPDDPITREQLAVMLWRYSGSPAATNRELPFSDANEIGDYALNALYWTVENKIINGQSADILNAKGLATRAQAAQMLKNYLEISN